MQKLTNKKAIVIKKPTRSKAVKTINIDYILNNFKDSKVIEYGRDIQSDIQSFTNSILKKTAAKDILDTNSSLIKLQKAIKETERARNGATGIVSRIKYWFIDKVDDIKNQAGNALQIVDAVESNLSKHQAILIEDSESYNKMQEMSMQYLKKLNQLIDNGEQQITEAKEYLKINFNDETINNPDVRQALSFIDSFEHRLADLYITQALIRNQIPSFEIAKRTNIIQINKINTVIANTIPIWKNAMVNSLYLAHSDSASENIKLVTDMTNQLIKDNADFNKDITKRVAIESERSIIDVETIEYFNKKMLETIEEINVIISEGRKNRIIMIDKLKKNTAETQAKLNHAAEQSFESNEFKSKSKF